MKYVLIFWLSGASYGPAISHDFNTKEACENAAAEVAAVKFVKTKLRSVCVPKG